MDLILTTILEYPAFWNYDQPLNFMALGSFFLGMLMQLLLIRKGRIWLFLPLVWLVVSLCCEYLYQTIHGLEAFGPAILGLFTYLAFFGSLLGILIYILWTKVRHF